MKKLNNEIQLLQPLVCSIKQEKAMEKKCSMLMSNERVLEFFRKRGKILKGLDQFDVDESYLVYSLIAIGQGESLFFGFEEDPNGWDRLKTLLQKLSEVEVFYSQIGGILGYHLDVLKLIVEEEEFSDSLRYLQPISNLANNSMPDVLAGLEALPKSIEIYPVGGAGDRLDLRDESTREPLPAACLPFLGHSLLTILIRDLQAKEYLYYKVYGRQIRIPIAMMTSIEKDNHNHVLRIGERNNWWGRKQGHFQFLLQPCVPVISESGNWIFSEPQELIMKPGGHGVVWKLAAESSFMSKWEDKGFEHIVLRQVNNPLASLDTNLFSLLGRGVKGKHCFGFLSCQRRLRASEGMDVLVERQDGNGFSYCLTNVEYTDFRKKGIKDIPDSKGSSYSQFPCNTNILYAHLPSIREAIKRESLPGKVLNMTHRYAALKPNGKMESVRGGRLEAMMQNIADQFDDTFDRNITEIITPRLKNFILYQDRKKTISVTKKSYQYQDAYSDTPESAFYDLMNAHLELLTNSCGFVVPALPSPQEYLDSGPSFIFLFHPALGPLWSVIGQKIRGGEMTYGSELQLEIAELDISDLLLDGSLLIHCDSVTGQIGEDGELIYGENTGKCTLRGVEVVNEGIDFNMKQCWWKNRYSRKESLQIIIHGNGEFFAENVILKGNWLFEIPENQRMVVTQKDGEVFIEQEPIDAATWFWKYDPSLRIETYCKT